MLAPCGVMHPTLQMVTQFRERGVSMRFAKVSERGILQSSPGDLGRIGIELLSLTITETSSIKPRRANRNSQGSQRPGEGNQACAKGTKPNKSKEQNQMKSTNQPASQTIIVQSLDQSINQTVKHSSPKQIKQIGTLTYRK